ncbi:hypothetical protein [Bathymodiolus thermophilus thioautotrophic gill symbiont]|nr:hypothetical protein [Bathymodiolus thermophilus thioautotrophic gill symbiont]
MNIKTLGSGEVDKNRCENIEKIQANEQLKFVIGSNLILIGVSIF